MFGLLMGLLHIGARTAAGISEIRDVEKNKQRCIDAGYDFYIDRNGTKRRLSNDEPFMERYDYKTGHTIEFNPYTGQIYKDITAIHLAKTEIESKEKAIKDGKGFYKFEPNRKTHSNDKIKGYRYKRVDDKQENIYIAREISGVVWYINIETGEYVAPEDSTITEHSTFYICDTHETISYNEKNGINRIKDYLNKSRAESIRRTPEWSMEDEVAFGTLGAYRIWL